MVNTKYVALRIFSMSELAVSFSFVVGVVLLPMNSYELFLKFSHAIISHIPIKALDPSYSKIASKIDVNASTSNKV